MANVDGTDISPLFFTVNVNIVDEEQKKALQSYDPQAPVTRKGVLRSLRTGRPIEIREDDLVRNRFVFVISIACETFHENHLCMR